MQNRWATERAQRRNVYDLARAGAEGGEFQIFNNAKESPEQQSIDSEIKKMAKKHYDGGYPRGTQTSAPEAANGA